MLAALLQPYAYTPVIVLLSGFWKTSGYTAKHDFRLISNLLQKHTLEQVS